MFKATDQNFLKMFFSNKEVVSEIHCLDDVVYIWSNFCPLFENVEYVYMVSPKTWSNYYSFVEKIKKEYPLLVELL